MAIYALGILTLFFTPLTAILVTDFVVSSLYGWDSLSRLYIDFYGLLREVRRLRAEGGGKRVERRLRKRAIVYGELRSKTMRVSFTRLFLLLPLYMVTVLASYRLGLYPYPLDIPGLTITLHGVSLVPATMLLLLSYIAWLPLLQYPPLFTLGLRGRAGSQLRRGV